jgi:hypothetical protein
MPRRRSTPLRAPLALAAALVLALVASPAALATPTGGLTLSSVTSRPGSVPAYDLAGTAQVTTDCPSGSSCGSWYAVITSVPADRACSSAGTGAWVGPVTQGAAGTFRAVWEERAPGPRRACLYLYDNDGKTLVGEAPYEPPPGTPQPPPPSTDPLAGLTTARIPAAIGRQGSARFVTSVANLPAKVRRARWEAMAETSARRWGLRSTGVTRREVVAFDRRNQVGFGDTRRGVLGVQRDSYLVRRTIGQRRCTLRDGRRVCRYRGSRILQRVLIDQDVTLNPRVPWQEGPAPPSDEEYDLQSVLVHELGHLAGNARHVPRCGRVSSPMIAALGPGEWWRSPGDRFIAGDCNAPANASRARPGLGLGRFEHVTLTRTVWVR